MPRRPVHNEEICDQLNIDFIGAFIGRNGSKWTFIIVRDFPSQPGKLIDVEMFTNMRRLLAGERGKKSKMEYYTFMNKYVWKNPDGTPRDGRLEDATYFCSRALLLV
jgi:hypothetical protein